jgi:hypothetical protein
MRLAVSPRFRRHRAESEKTATDTRVCLRGVEKTRVFV